MEKQGTSLFIRKDLKKRAETAIDKGYFSGITSFSGLVEKALTELLDSIEVKA